jgi:hypothetical protein
VNISIAAAAITAAPNRGLIVNPLFVRLRSHTIILFSRKLSTPTTVNRLGRGFPVRSRRSGQTDEEIAHVTGYAVPLIGAVLRSSKSAAASSSFESVTIR